MPQTPAIIPQSIADPMTLTSRVSLLVGLIFLWAGCATTPEVVPPATQTMWSFDPDFETRTRANVSIGDDLDAVVTALGKPDSRERFTKDVSIEVLHYVRSVIGPRRMRTVKAANGFVNVTDNIRYSDAIDIYMKDGKVLSVGYKRSLEPPKSAIGNLTPPF